ncbi:hypothetical protein [Agarivorans sp. DSG3-1]|uniref:hypothetical protein n=1 Tax=Agarivorans sp. DSG3-1 TaxID=3342249 RepID=UPI00398F806C
MKKCVTVISQAYLAMLLTPFAVAEVEQNSEMFVLNFEGPDYVRTIRYTKPYRDGDRWEMGSFVYDKTVTVQGLVTIFNGELKLGKQSDGRVFVYQNASDYQENNWTVSLIINEDLTGSFIDQKGSNVHEFVGSFSEVEGQVAKGDEAYSDPLWQIAYRIQPKQGIYTINGVTAFEGEVSGKHRWLSNWVFADRFQFTNKDSSSVK